MTLAVYLRSWLTTAATLTLSPKTTESYTELVTLQIVPWLGIPAPAAQARTDRGMARHATPRGRQGRHPARGPHPFNHAHASSAKRYATLSSHELIYAIRPPRSTPPRAAFRD